jgi:F-type H+-transporting ATPase subunit b
MQFDWWTFALQTINFAILVWLLHRFLYRPILRMIDARRSAIDRQIADAKTTEATAKARLAEIESQRANIATEREQAIKAASQKADEVMRTRKAQAEKDAAAVLDEARKTLAKEREAAAAETHRAALDLAADIARRLIAEMPAERRAEAWLDRIEQYLAGLPPGELAKLKAQIGASTPVTVVTATQLTEAAARAWQDRLRKPLGTNLALKFAVDPALIAGVELHFPEAIIRLSLQSALTKLQSEIDSRGDACR